MADPATEQSDQALDERSMIEAAQQDPARFGDLYRLHFHRVYAYVARRVADRPSAEDVTAEVFRDALAGIGKFEWRGVPFAAWLMRIASRAVSDHWKKQARTPGLEPGETGMDSEPASAAGAERDAILFQLVDRLPEAQFRVIHMRFVEQKSIREIAQALDRSEGAVKQLQLRAIETLRSQMEGGHA